MAEKTAYSSFLPFPNPAYLLLCPSILPAAINVKGDITAILTHAENNQNLYRMCKMVFYYMIFNHFCPFE
jgi:hypothetical protein